MALRGGTGKFASASRPKCACITLFAYNLLATALRPASPITVKELVPSMVQLREPVEARETHGTFDRYPVGRVLGEYFSPPRPVAPTLTFANRTAVPD